MNLTPSEKLILMMLAEIHDKLGIKDGIDPKFVQEAIHTGNTWGLEWRYSGVFDATETPKAVRDEVLNVLDMWDTLESSYENLSASDKKRVDAEAKPFAGPLKFRGFDGNNETDHLGAARFLIDYMDRFTRFSGRDLNAHMPTIDGYRRMYAVFEGKRPTFSMSGLSADDIITILKEMVHPSRRP